MMDLLFADSMYMSVIVTRYCLANRLQGSPARYPRYHVSQGSDTSKRGSVGRVYGSNLTVTYRMSELYSLT